MDADTLPPLRVGIIGTGGVAHLHAAALTGRDDTRIVAAIDTDAERAGRFAAQYGIPASGTSFAELPEVDVLHLCTPPGVHAEQAEAAFALGAHVVVEKPPALSLAEVDRMLAAAERAGRRLAVVFQQRTGTAAAHVRGLLRTGALGRPLVARCDTLWYRDDEYFAVPWRGRWDTEGGGTTFGHGIHQLDLLAHLLGDVDEVTGQAWRVGREIETEDVSTAVLRFASGVVASVLTSAVSPRQSSSIRIDTERATVELEHLYGHGHDHWRITPAPHVDPTEAAGWAFPADEVASGHQPYLDAVYTALRSGAPLPDVADEPTRSLEIVEALYLSTQRGGAVRIAELREDPRLRSAVRADVVDLRPEARP
ncbi:MULTISPECIES: Gfo/Idh/MocA family protein [unclassified Rathayibacter]|uniref:Gfo/Idh/MocA family protein n=1 Tax=unclassified Rathayibacter TaxID=2609250 RepID=UPI0006F61E2B|nr:MULTISPECIES: Gfo/Idh/MocA family oxidoreductase [unclassified Rathayibacter]KQQ05540.1 dehydrogenase [Rathayibacter sp. Leaf294]KQS13403.1 dehydrogenase [Rathayibacter sp. Leaf185]